MMHDFYTFGPCLCVLMQVRADVGDGVVWNASLNAFP